MAEVWPRWGSREGPLFVGTSIRKHRMLGEKEVEKWSVESTHKVPTSHYHTRMLMILQVS
jgi:hypothetical protein